MQQIINVINQTSDFFRCTVIIVNWNSWAILSFCLEKLQQQTFQNFNVLVIDNASAEPAPNDFLTHHPNVTLVQNKSNLGFAAANNQAIKLAKDSDWVVLLNPDAFAEPDWLEQLVNAAIQYPDYAMYASRQLMDGNQELLDGDGDVYHTSGLVWRDGHGRPVRVADDRRREIFSPCAAEALHRGDA